MDAFFICGHLCDGPVRPAEVNLAVAGAGSAVTGNAYRGREADYFLSHNDLLGQSLRVDRSARAFESA